MEFGTSVGTQNDAGLPNITGDLGTSRFLSAHASAATGVFKNTVQTQTGSDVGLVNKPNWNIASNGGENYNVFDFDASESNVIYGNSTTVQPKSLVVSAIIKY